MLDSSTWAGSPHQSAHRPTLSPVVLQFPKFPKFHIPRGPERETEARSGISSRARTDSTKPSPTNPRPEMNQLRELRAAAPTGVTRSKDPARTEGKSGPDDGVTHVRCHGGPVSLPPSRSVPLGIGLTTGTQKEVTSCLSQTCKTPRGMQDLAGLRTRVTAPPKPQVVCACASQGLLGNVVRRLTLSPQNYKKTVFHWRACAMQDFWEI